MTWQIVAAIVGAACVAVGAAAQERPTCEAGGHAVGKLSLLKHLLTSRRWLAGAAVTGCGMLLHLAAITTAPLSIVQPLGISGLLMAVWIAARWRGRKLRGREAWGAVAVTAGLCGLVWSLPRHGGQVDVHDDGLVLMVLLVLAAAAVTAGSGSVMSARTRAWLFAAVAGACFGVTAALARVVARDVLADVAAAWQWRSLAIVISALVGSWLLQNAYRANHFGMSYATLLVCDPVMAAAIGFAVLHEPLPGSVADAAIAVVSGLVTVVGVVALSHSKNTGPAAPAPHGGAGADNTNTKELDNVEPHRAVDRGHVGAAVA
ncbi:MAG TPA: DMT family transporter [Candidatus Stackebrandtia faecavium]|nr:DMT family transporter [Candidatus Stackebrandtia faecavium]